MTHDSLPQMRLDAVKQKYIVEQQISLFENTISSKQIELISQRRQNQVEIKATLILALAILGLIIFVNGNFVLGLGLPTAIFVVWTTKRFRHIDMLGYEMRELSQKIQELEIHLDQKIKIQQKE